LWVGLDGKRAGLGNVDEQGFQVRRIRSEWIGNIPRLRLDEVGLAIIPAIYGIEITASHRIDAAANAPEDFGSNGRECVTLPVIVSDLDVLLFHVCKCPHLSSEPINPLPLT
jgi:hypothetical protein